MKKATATTASRLWGVLILISVLPLWRLGLSPHAFVHISSWLGFAMWLGNFLSWACCLCGGIGLIAVRPFGFWCMLGAFAASFFGVSFFFIPFLWRLFGFGRELWNAYSLGVIVSMWASNLAVLLILGCLEYRIRWRKAPDQVQST